MSRPLLALDVDEVSFPLTVNYVETHNELHGTDFTVDHFNTYNYEDNLQQPLEVVAKQLADFTMRDNLHIEPIEYTVEGIHRLLTKFDIDIVTARHPEWESHTVNWLQEKIGEFFGNIHLIGYSPMMGEHALTKAEVCQKIGAFALIDDSPSHVIEMARIGREGVLFGDYPWNRGADLPPGVVRCNTMLEVADHFGV